jgi:chaperone modulatory protein CbpM
MSTTTRFLDGSMPELQAELSLIEVCRCCTVQTDFIAALVEEGIIAPSAGSEPSSWRFADTQLHHIARAWRLQRDLGVNLAGAALALQLLDEVQTLRAQITANAAPDR